MTSDAPSPATLPAAPTRATSASAAAATDDHLDLVAVEDGALVTRRQTTLPVRSERVVFVLTWW